MTTEDTATPGRRLGEYAKRRREELDLTQAEVATLGKIGLSTYQKVEYGNASPDRDTRRSLDAGLFWEPGSTEFVLAGKEPVPMPVDRMNLRSIVDLVGAQRTLEDATNQYRAARASVDRDVAMLAAARAGEDAEAMSVAESHLALSRVHADAAEQNMVEARRVVESFEHLSGIGRLSVPSGRVPPIAKAGGRGEGDLSNEERKEIGEVAKLLAEAAARLARIAEPDA